MSLLMDMQTKLGDLIWKSLRKPQQTSTKLGKVYVLLRLRNNVRLWNRSIRQPGQGDASHHSKISTTTPPDRNNGNIDEEAYFGHMKALRFGVLSTSLSRSPIKRAIWWISLLGETPNRPGDVRKEVAWRLSVSSMSPPEDGFCFSVGTKITTR